MATSVIFWNLESGNREIAWNWLILTNLYVLGIFPTQFLSLNLILSSELQNSTFPEIFPEIFRKSGNSQEFAVWGQCQHIGYQFHSILVIKIHFEVRISKFKYFWNLSRNFLPTPKYWVDKEVKQTTNTLLTAYKN